MCRTKTPNDVIKFSVCSPAISIENQRGRSDFFCNLRSAYLLIFLLMSIVSEIRILPHDYRSSPSRSHSHHSYVCTSLDVYLLYLLYLLYLNLRRRKLSQFHIQIFTPLDGIRITRSWSTLSAEDAVTWPDPIPDVPPWLDTCSSASRCRVASAMERVRESQSGHDTSTDSIGY